MNVLQWIFGGARELRPQGEGRAEKWPLSRRKCSEQNWNMGRKAAICGDNCGMARRSRAASV
jgi:hypothetical protein